eukprot:TRINITY_DN30202_c0_g1_i2.p1 TRINITY_DN30202_c0_g1~~TRINITY_DN30202_c0_g1_i2.p1  ORF type:complete len:393 (+),score=58.09 TRINITY_DN30202_c0_g1_i2:113-1291(+)
MLGKFPTSLYHDRAELQRGTAVMDIQKRMVFITRCGEKEVLAALAREVHVRLAECLERLAGRTAEAVGGSVWFCLLRDRKAAVEEARGSGKLSQHFGALQTAPLSADAAATEASHAHFCCLVFMWLHDLLRHPLTIEAAPFIRCSASADKGDGNRLSSASSCWIAWASEASREEGTFLALFLQKLALWGRFLAAQFLSAGAFATSDMNSMQMEAVGLRQQLAWSVPTDEALKTIAHYGPLVEVGGGTGLWAQLLTDIGADIVSFDLPQWDSTYGDAQAEGDALQGQHRNALVRTGGPEVLIEHAERSLLLMWPDYQGVGSFGLECLRNYAGKTLVLVGEWQNQTFGLVRPWGQSFSKEFQEVVEAEFERVKVVPLPNWPLFCDILTVWQRKA